MLKFVCVLAGVVGFPVAVYQATRAIFHVTPLRDPVNNWVQTRKGDLREWYAGYRYRRPDVPWEKLDDL